VGDLTLDNPALIDFLAHCANEGAAVLVHPWDIMGSERMRDYMTKYTVGMPAETHLTIASMILGGAFDALPESLRICFAHGGGSFPGLIGRLDQAWHYGPGNVGKGKSSRPPSAYVDRFFVDSIVYQSRTLEFLVDIMGEDRIVLGSDYPFAVAEQEIGGVVRNSKLVDGVKEKILSANPGHFLALDP